VNLIAALVAFVALSIAARPADDRTATDMRRQNTSRAASKAADPGRRHHHHLCRVQTFLNPAPLESLGIGLVISLVASAINFGVAQFMFRKGAQYDSITLEADGHHLMTDVWTSVGVVAGLIVMLLVPTWTWLDPLIAMLLGINIIRTGVSLLKRSAAGLMDITLHRKRWIRSRKCCARRRAGCGVPQAAHPQVGIAALCRVSPADAQDITSKPRTTGAPPSRPNFAVGCPKRGSLFTWSRRRPVACRLGQLISPAPTPAVFRRTVGSLWCIRQEGCRGNARTGR